MRPVALLDQRDLCERALYLFILLFKLAGQYVCSTKHLHEFQWALKGRAEWLLPSGAASGTGTKT